MLKNKSYDGYYGSATYSLSGKVYLNFIDENNVTMNINGHSYDMKMKKYNNYTKFVTKNKEKMERLMTVVFPKYDCSEIIWHGFYTMMEPLDCGKLAVFINSLEYPKLRIKYEFDALARKSLKGSSLRTEYSQDSKL